MAQVRLVVGEEVHLEDEVVVALPQEVLDPRVGLARLTARPDARDLSAFLRI